MRVQALFGIVIGTVATWSCAWAASSPDIVTSPTDIKSLLTDARNDANAGYFSDATKELAMASTKPGQTRSDKEEISSIKGLIATDADYAAIHNGSRPPT